MKRWIGRLVARVDVRVAGRGFRPVLRLGAFAVGHPLESGEYRCRKDRLSGLFSAQAARVANYMDTVRSHVSYGFKYGPLRFPVILHTENFVANGIVMWAPKRIELEANSAVGPVRRAVAQTTGDARIPARRTVRQPAPAVHEMGRLRGRTAGGFA